MHLFGLVLFGFVAFFWLTRGLRVAYGAIRLPWIRDFAPASDADCPRISIPFAARDAEEKLPAAFAPLVGDVETVGFWEPVLITFFGMTFPIVTDPYRVPHPNSRAYIGVGAFQLLKRTAYEASGTHCRLAMEVVDDMKLGKIVKQSGFRSEAGIAQDFVVVRWHVGLSNIIRGVTKNFFAGAGYSVPLVAIAVSGVLLMNVAPVFGILFGHGWSRIFAV